MSKQIGIIGLGPMGLGLARNLSSKGYEVFSWDRDLSGSTMARQVHYEKNIILCSSLRELIKALTGQRSILISIKSGSPVDEIISQVRPLLAAGDILVDCGNSHHKDTKRRCDMLTATNIGFLGVGISGGPRGAENGPSIMVGGSQPAWKLLKTTFETISAHRNGVACCGYFGADGSGHYVKMVHNGIEYALMHLLMEAYALLNVECSEHTQDIHKNMSRLNQGLTGSYLTEITSKVVSAMVPNGDDLLIKTIDGTTAQNGTGQWTVEAALIQGTPVPTIAEAVMYRAVTSQKIGPKKIAGARNAEGNAGGSCNIEWLPGALALAFVSVFTQGLNLFDSCSSILGKPLNRLEILKVWQSGSILRGAMIDFLIVELTSGENDDAGFIKKIANQEANNLQSTRSLVGYCSRIGLMCPGFSSALYYVEAMITGRLPSEILQLQRDYFGRHGLRDKITGEIIDANW